MMNGGGILDLKSKIESCLTNANYSIKLHDQIISILQRNK